jgi:hypothetical protein
MKPNTRATGLLKGKNSIENISCNEYVYSTADGLINPYSPFVVYEEAWCVSVFVGKYIDN